MIVPMSPESHENIVKLEGEHIREKNLLQIDLARRLYGEQTEDRFAEEWIPAYSARFGQLFEAEIESNSDLFTELADPAKREEILKRFEDALYGAEDMKKAA